MIKPMLAQTYHKVAEKHRTFPCYIQPKYDGIRCIYHTEKFYSRNGKLIVSVPELLNEHKPLLRGLVTDGELYEHGQDFNTIQSLVMRTVNKHPNRFNIKYIIYDICSFNQKRSFSHRKEALNYLRRQGCLVAPTYLVKNIEELLTQHQNNLANGFEGSIIRHPDYVYEEKRSFGLLKLKNFIDEEFLVVGYQEGTGKYEGMLGSLILETAEGKQFCVGTGFDDDMRHAFWNQREGLIAQFVTVKFQEKSKKDHIPRFPVFKDFRS